MLYKLDIIIEDRSMHFEELFILKCLELGTVYLPMHSKKMADGCYKIMVKDWHYEGIQKYR